MKNRKSFTALVLAIALLSLLALSACGSKTLEGTFTDTPDWNAIMDLSENESEVFAGAGYWDMGLTFANIEQYVMQNKITFNTDGSYTYTMLSILSDTIDPNFDRDATAYCEVTYTGTYTAGKEANTWVLAFPTECVWSYNPGLFASLGSTASANNSYSAGATTVTWFGDMSGSVDVMSAFGHRLQHFSTQADTSVTMTVTVDAANNTFSIVTQ